MATDYSDWIGSEICNDRYRIETLVGRGGMGVVLRAHDKSLNAAVAVKVVSPALLADTQFVQRFDREARSLVNLVHPHVVRILDVGRHNAVPFLVMQFLSGGSLAE